MPHSDPPGSLDTVPGLTVRLLALHPWQEFPSSTSQELSLTRVAFKHIFKSRRDLLLRFPLLM